VVNFEKSVKVFYGLMGYLIFQISCSSRAILTVVINKFDNPTNWQNMTKYTQKLELVKQINKC